MAETTHLAQVSVEVLRLGGQVGRLAQVSVEAIRNPGLTHLAQVSAETLAGGRHTRLAQVSTEVLWKARLLPPPPPCEPLPRWIALGATGGPEYAVSVFTASGGWEQRVQHWPQVRGRWDVSFLNRSAAEIATLLAFFRAVAHGRAETFCFTDGLDHTFNNRIGTGDGTLTTFQLIKVYTSGNLTYSRKLTRPIVTSIRITVNGIPTTDYVIDPLGGLVVFGMPPPSGAVIMARGEFEVLVRFDMDTLQITCVTLGVFSCTGLGLIEVVGE